MHTLSDGTQLLNNDNSSNCQECGVKLGRYSSATLCDNCYQDVYEKNHPDWKRSHPCQICDTVITYPGNLSPFEWGGSYHSCCSDECRGKLLSGKW